MPPSVEEGRGRTGGRPNAAPSGAAQDGLCFGASEQDQEEEHDECRISVMHFVETLIA